MSLREVGNRLGCDKETVRKWLRKHGIQTRAQPQDIDTKQRFWEKVDKNGPDGCWEWTGYQNPDGYGHVTIGGKVHNAHRVVYSWEQEDPGEQNVLHKCDNPPCVNPRHLYLGSQGDNLRDAYERERREPLDMSGESAPGAKLSKRDVRKIKARLERGEHHQQIADDYEVSRATITLIANGTTWSDIEALAIDGGEDGA